MSLINKILSPGDTLDLLHPTLGLNIRLLWTLCDPNYFPRLCPKRLHGGILGSFDIKNQFFGGASLRSFLKGSPRIKLEET